MKVRCKSCGHVTTVPALEEAAPAHEDRTSVVSMDALAQLRQEAKAAQAPPKPKLDVSAQWFAMVKGAQVGPLDAGMLAAKLRAGELHGRSYVWKNGMAEWKRVEDLPELSSLLNPPAPPPAPVAPPAPPPPPSIAKAKPVARPRIAEPVAEPVREPEPEPQPAADEAPLPFESEPAPRASAALDTLFSDEDLPPADASTSKAKAQEAPADDPFAALGGMDPNNEPPPGEATRFFMAQAGVTRRNPPWKIALFIAAGIGVPVLVLFALSQLNVVPLTVTHVNSEGQEVKESVFSAGGMTGLGDLLLGRNKNKPPQTVTPPPEKKEKVAKKTAPTPDVAPEKKDPNAPSSDDLAAFYGSNELKTVGPKVKIQAEKPALEKGSGGLDEEQVVKVVGQSQTAFQTCIESELRKNPNLKVGKIIISATVATSGVVTKAEIDKNDVNKSALGDCLKNRARRMVFAAFQGDEEAEIQIPLMVTTAM